MMGPYKVKYYAYNARSVVTNTAPTASYRGVAAPICTFAMESLLARAAEELDIDPVEIRRRNLIKSADLPYVNAVNVTHDTASNVECLDRALDLSRYFEFRQTKSGKLGEDGKLRGIGLACMADHTGQGTSVTRMRRQASRWPGYDGALVKIEPDGKATVHVSVASQGQGQATIFAQLPAELCWDSTSRTFSVELSDTASSSIWNGCGREPESGRWGRAVNKGIYSA